MPENLRRLFYATCPDVGVRAFWRRIERDDFVTAHADNPAVRAVTYRQIKTFYPATLPGGKRRFILPDGRWIGR